MNSKDFRVTEVFYALQGESKWTGTPSIFVRLFGCNFSCAGFGMPNGELSNERNEINPADFDKLEDLPLVTTGCDSYAAWDPRFKRFSAWNSVDDLAKRIYAILPDGEWEGVHLIITGGEPLLGWQSKYPALLSHPLIRRCTNLTFETNSTQVLTPELTEYLVSRFEQEQVFFSMSVKLPHSGHDLDQTVIPEAVDSYAPFDAAFKFVVGSEEDVEAIKWILGRYENAGVVLHDTPVYIMPIGGVVNEYDKYKITVANIALANRWRFSDRLHVSLFGNQWGV